MTPREEGDGSHFQELGKLPGRVPMSQLWAKGLAQNDLSLTGWARPLSQAPWVAPGQWGGGPRENHAEDDWNSPKVTRAQGRQLLGGLLERTVSYQEKD